MNGYKIDSNVLSIDTIHRLIIEMNNSKIEVLSFLINDRSIFINNMMMFIE